MFFFITVAMEKRRKKDLPWSWCVFTVIETLTKTEVGAGDRDISFEKFGL